MNTKEFNPDDLLNRKFGLLTVKELSSIENKKPIVYRYLCECECGNKVIIIRSNILSHTRSCGCLKKKTGKDTKGYKGYEEISGCYWNKIIKGAEKRNFEFSITLEYAWNIFLNQNRKCNLSGLEIGFTRTTRNRKDPNSKLSNTKFITASLDRIDSKKGYIEGNIQWVHRKVNTMKWDFVQDEFIEICRLISNNNVKK